MSPNALSRRNFIIAGGAIGGAALLAGPVQASVNTLPFLVVGDWGDPSEPAQRIVAASMGEVATRIESAFVISTGDNSLVLRETMKDLERRLDPRKFQRVHRSTIVNLDLVRQVRPHTNGECFLVLESGAEVKVSRSYRDVVARFVH